MKAYFIRLSNLFTCFFLIISVLFLSSCSTNLYDVSALTFFKSNEDVICASTYSELDAVAIVSNKGNCYINGSWFDDENNFGVDNIIQFNNRYKDFDNSTGDEYVQIYDGGDAKKVCISSAGGTIITNNDSLIIFVNGNKDYRFPTKFSNNCIDGYLYDDNTVYCLQKNGDFGYYHISSPEDFNIIASNILKFKFQKIRPLSGEVKKDNIYLLTKDNRLYAVDKDQRTLDESKYISDVTDFDVCDNTKVAFLKNDGTFWYLNKYNANVTIEYIMDNTIKQNLHQKDIKMFTLYGSGIVFLYENGNVYVRGYDIDYNGNNDVLHDEIIDSNGQKIFADQRSICLIDRNNNLTYYGLSPNGINNLLFKKLPTSLYE